MKKTIKKEEDRVILNVSLSTEEMRSGKTVLFTLYDAQNFLKREGYNIATCVEDKSVINVGLNANNRGKFVFLLKEEKPKPVVNQYSENLKNNVRQRFTAKDIIQDQLESKRNRKYVGSVKRFNY